MSHIAIIGAGGFGQEVAWLIEDINNHGVQWVISGYIDDDPSLLGKMVGSYVVLGGIQWLKENPEIHAICAIGNSVARESIVNQLGNACKFATLIHPSVLMPTSSLRPKIGVGSIVCAGSILTVAVTIGRHVVVNVACTIGHDTDLGDFATLLPGCNVSGFVVLEPCVSVGTGSQIIQRIRIGRSSIIGAGAVVVRNLPPECTAVGVPAKPIKFHTAD